MLTKEDIIKQLPADALDTSMWWLRRKWTLKEIARYMSISSKNSKLGKTCNISTLPGNKNNLLILKNGTQLTDVPGTCSNCEACFKDCYAVHSAKRFYNNNIMAWGRNTIIKHLNPQLYFYLIDMYISIKKCSVFRIHVSGEFESTREILEWAKIARKHSETVFYGYTKMYFYLVCANPKHNFPKNFIINLSEWNNKEEIEEIRKQTGLGSFAYVTEENYHNYKKIPMCPAVNRDGSMNENKECINCPLCKLPIVKGCWSH